GAQDALVTHIILMGSATFYITDGTQVEAQAGDIVLIPSGKAHHVSNDRQSKLIDSMSIDHLFTGHLNDAIEFGSGSNEHALIFT
ncbi:cupin domain-containing protein, partial [Escherichia coli]|uniref:cupin domain-containing protein n=1 Tax=Escherichia coli TaxID=562 RepID=UPI001EDB465C